MARVQTDRIGRTKKKKGNRTDMLCIYFLPPLPKFYYFLLYTITQMHRRYSAGHTHGPTKHFLAKAPGQNFPTRNGNWAIGRERETKPERGGGYGYARLNRKEKGQTICILGENKKRKSGASHTNRKV
jgi:hypothetical protein